MGSAAVATVADEDSATEYAGTAAAGRRPHAATNPKASRHAWEVRMAVVSIGIGGV